MTHRRAPTFLPLSAPARPDPNSLQQSLNSAHERSTYLQWDISGRSIGPPGREVELMERQRERRRAEDEREGRQRGGVVLVHTRAHALDCDFVPVGESSWHRDAHTCGVWWLQQLIRLGWPLGSWLSSAWPVTTPGCLQSLGPAVSSVFVLHNSTAKLNQRGERGVRNR